MIQHPFSLPKFGQPLKPWNIFIFGGYSVLSHIGIRGNEKAEFVAKSDLDLHPIKTDFLVTC